jgi:hypothetical protein
MMRTNPPPGAQRRAPGLAVAAMLVATLGAGCSGRIDGGDQAAGDPSDAAETTTVPRDPEVAGAADEKSDEDGPGDATDEEPTTTTGPVDPAADQAAAEAAVLSAADLPGWEEGYKGLLTGMVQPDRAERFDEVGDCLGTPLIEEGVPAAHSPTYSTVLDGGLSASVIFTPSVADAEHLMDVVREPETPGCYAESAAAEMDQFGVPDGTVRAPTGEPAEIEQFGDDSAAVHIAIPDAMADLPPEDALDLGFHVVDVRVGRVVIVITATGSRLDDSLIRDLVDQMVGRLPAG